MRTSTSLSSPSSNGSHCSKCSHCRDRTKPTGHGSEKSTTEDSSIISISASRTSTPPKSNYRARTPRPRVTFRDATNLPHAGPSDPSNQIPITLSRPLRPQSMMQMHMPMPMPMPMMPSHEPRLHPFAPAPILHNLGRGPEPRFGWESVMPLNHGYGQPKYIKRVKPDYRRFCFSVGKADVPFAAMPGGPLWGMDVTMAPQMVGSHRW
jgi:hypothetical protein